MRTTRGPRVQSIYLRSCRGGGSCPTWREPWVSPVTPRPSKKEKKISWFYRQHPPPTHHRPPTPIHLCFKDCHGGSDTLVNAGPRGSPPLPPRTFSPGKSSSFLRREITAKHRDHRTLRSRRRSRRHMTAGHWMGVDLAVSPWTPRSRWRLWC